VKVNPKALNDCQQQGCVLFRIKLRMPLNSNINLNMMYSTIAIPFLVKME